ncbi:MAG: AAA family ATPase [Chloroflexota bacterium]|nr:AAA family ATPase [Chloroflexota bacterium]
MDSDSPTPPAPALRRFPTRVPGLDTVLGGGFLAGDTYLITGAPGTGKTTLGNQLAFAHAAAGGTVLFATLLTESHDRMLAHLQDVTFFDRALVGDRIHYISLMASIQEGDFAGTLQLLVEMLRDYGASLLVIDGAGLARMFATSTVEYLRFVHGLNTRASAFGCTTVLLTGHREEETVATHVDGVIQLSNVAISTVSVRDARWLRVAKLRGSDYLSGQHRFAIGAGGVTVYPRLEAAHAELMPTWYEPEHRLALGIPGLDAMLGGGLQDGSSTLVVGTPGAGKTVLGLHFLAEGARHGERGLFAGFHETPPALAATADQLGMALGPHLESGLVRTMWRPPLELAPDEWAWQLLAAVEEHRPRRLVIDGYSDLIPLFAIPERRAFFPPALVNRLRDLRVTALIVLEIDAFAGPALTLPVQNVSASMDNGILLRSVEVQSSLSRMVSVLKQRQTGFDPTIREFTIGPGGMVVGDPFDASALLTGVADPI